MANTFLRYLLCAVGVGLILPALGLIALVVVRPITISGAAYLLGYLLVAMGLILAPWRLKPHFVLGLSGLIVIVAVGGARIGLAHRESSTLKVIELPSTNHTRWLNSLLDEQDSVVFGEAVLYFLGGVTPHEDGAITSALSTAYAETQKENGVFPSPFLSTYLGFQRPAAFDAVVVEPTAAPKSPIGVVFLHGWMGNVTVQCWQMAQAVSKIGAVTVCPSTSWKGDWWTPDGEAIIQATFRYLLGRGIQRIYLGGFSNGGIGIGKLITALATEPALQGLFFIAGVSNGEAVRKTRLPVLVIQGTQDERMPVEAARRFVGEISPQATYVELEADHFLIMKQPHWVQEAISHWLEGQEN